MKLLKKEWLQLLILAAPFCAAALLWNKLPDRMPVHWNVAGEIDGYAGRAFGAYFMPCLSVGLVLLLAALPLLDPRIRAYDAAARANMSRVIRIIRLALTGFLSLIDLAVLAIALKLPLNMSLIVTIGSALLFVVLGNVLSKVRPNFFIGIRTPWTLDSKEVWTKTHRLAGKVFVIGGLLLVPLSLLVPSAQYLYFIFLPLTLIMAFIPAVYSYWYFKRLPRA